MATDLRLSVAEVLNPRDSIIVQALLTNFNGDIKVDGRIVGVPSIRRAERQWRTPVPLRAYVLAFAAFAIIAAGGVFLTLPSPSVQTVLLGGPASTQQMQQAEEHNWLGVCPLPPTCVCFRIRAPARA